LRGGRSAAGGLPGWPVGVSVVAGVMRGVLPEKRFALKSDLPLAPKNDLPSRKTICLKNDLLFSSLPSIIIVVDNEHKKRFAFKEVRYAEK